METGTTPSCLATRRSEWILFLRGPQVRDRIASNELLVALAEITGVICGRHIHERMAAARPACPYVAALGPDDAVLGPRSGVVDKFPVAVFARECPRHWILALRPGPEQREIRERVALPPQVKRDR